MTEPVSETGSVKASIDALLQAGAWLVAVIVLFVAAPPRLMPADDAIQSVRTAQFLVAVLLALAIVAVRRGRPRLRTIWSAAASCLVAGTATLFAYLWLLGERTCGYDGRGPVVIGQTFTTEAARYAAAVPGSDCKTLIQDAAGRTDAIWPRSELVANHLLLVGAFIATVVLFALSAVFAGETLRRAREL
ncbi:hypothetical protein [Sphingomonas sp. R86520]|uniref:hypothetical protein n=1 Tax=Sphingomonas sp. R86520 TaxID=3093859 RepID=UPI0036D38EEE